MSIVAWDRNFLAADRQLTTGNLKMRGKKLFKRPEKGLALAFTGDLGAGLQMVQWFDRGCIASEYPAVQSTNDWARLIVASRRKLLVYEHLPVAIDYSHLKFHAFGSGRDFAIAAMHLKNSAIKAVEVASKYDDGCGLGVDYAVLE